MAGLDISIPEGSLEDSYGSRRSVHGTMWNSSHMALFVGFLAEKWLGKPEAQLVGPDSTPS